MKDYYDVEEGAAEEACRSTAERNGRTVAEADLCDGGSVGCPDCPFVSGLTKSVPDVCPECAGSGKTGSIGLPRECPYCAGTGKRR